MDHIKRIADEFGRQAQTFDTWAEKTDDRVAERFDRSARPSNSGDRAANALTTMLRLSPYTGISDNVRQVECWFSHIIGLMIEPIG